jgi:hypothetical protein
MYLQHIFLVLSYTTAILIKTFLSVLNTTLKSSVTYECQSLIWTKQNPSNKSLALSYCSFRALLIKWIIWKWQMFNKQELSNIQEQ